MKVVVCTKQTPSTTAVFSVENGTVSWDDPGGKPNVVNPWDEYTIEEGIRLKENPGATDVVAISLGDEDSQEALKTALAMGCGVWFNESCMTCTKNVGSGSTSTQLENSDVLPSGSVAVAVMNSCPAYTANDVEKLCVPLASVLMLARSNDVLPSPWPDGSHSLLVKNSIS